MTEKINVQNSAFLPANTGNGNLSAFEEIDFKAAFFLLTAKPDTHIRMLKGKKQVSIAEIRSLNEQVNKKLSNETLEGSVTKVNIILKDGNLKDFGSYQAFSEEPWDTYSSTVVNISLEWELLFRFPNRIVPQTHSLKLRIGNALPPKDMFQLMFTMDNTSEAVEAMSDAVCKIDFINQVMANELLNIISKWYEGLSEVPEVGLLPKFLTAKEDFILGFVNNFTPIAVLGLYHMSFCSVYSKMKLGMTPDLPQFELIIIVILFVYLVGSILGRLFARRLKKKINSYETYSQFLITKADKNAIEKTKSDNDKVTSQIFGWFIKIISGGVVTYFLKLLLDHFFK